MNFLHRIQAIIIIDDMGNRIFCKYYTGEDTSDASKALAGLDAQKALEKSIHQHISKLKTNTYTLGSELAVVEGHSVVYMICNDVWFIVLGDTKENEVILCNVLETLVRALKEELDTHIISTGLLLKEYQAILFTVDEMIDQGIILQLNAANIAEVVAPYLVDTSSETARKTLSTVNRYFRDNL
ncbi:coatomer zeta subunit [Strigomonas culicis]|uniref:Coatomer subunit zeta n=1 Tax=Strigomonas culicis TaxID=28005 RepID=S9UY56_9TRYP|nr:coatomer zeta subunit [Strigomonas culicis]EPY35787.1 coatomer zeta subunit [Strigomonas culicis]|eukprot:EPY23699.1 coatomer zeta subunit [Strigomonas culicis]